MMRGIARIAVGVAALLALTAAPAGAAAQPGDCQNDSKLIGPIQIKEAFSLVGIPAPMVDRVIAAMEKTTLRGRKVQVRRDR